MSYTCQATTTAWICMANTAASRAIKKGKNPRSCSTPRCWGRSGLTDDSELIDTPIVVLRIHHKAMQCKR
ncbi:hypothetical protein GCM10022394_03120 [Zobellella aerophila]|uniref:Uncharacterized protein n=1 Tax=Zobellella aerophila TaxID=870480 RepID=A0ABP6V5U2_9GAMM